MRHASQVSGRSDFSRSMSLLPPELQAGRAPSPAKGDGDGDPASNREGAQPLPPSRSAVVRDRRRRTLKLPTLEDAQKATQEATQEATTEGTTIPRCRHCAGALHPLAGPGRHEIYKTVKVEVPAELAIPTCERCGERWLGPVATQELEKIYSEMLLRMASEQLGKLADASVEQKRVESALGLSQGYLSHIKAGRNAPSPMLVSELVLLAKDPERRLKEVERFWRRKAA